MNVRKTRMSRWCGPDQRFTSKCKADRRDWCFQKGQVGSVTERWLGPPSGKLACVCVWTSGELTELRCEPDVRHYVNTASAPILHVWTQRFTWILSRDAVPDPCSPRLLRGGWGWGDAQRQRHQKWARHRGCTARLSPFFQRAVGERRRLTLLAAHQSFVEELYCRDNSAASKAWGFLRLRAARAVNSRSPCGGEHTRSAPRWLALPWWRETSPWFQAEGTQLPPYPFLNSLFSCKSPLISTAYLYLPGSSFLFRDTNRPDEGKRREKCFCNSTRRQPFSI